MEPAVHFGIFHYAKVLISSVGASLLDELLAADPSAADATICLPRAGTLASEIARSLSIHLAIWRAGSLESL